MKPFTEDLHDRIDALEDALSNVSADLDDGGWYAVDKAVERIRSAVEEQECIDHAARHYAAR